MKRILVSALVSLGLSGCFDLEDLKVVVEDNFGSDQVNFATFNVNSFPLNKVVCDPFGGGSGSAPRNGVKAKLFYRMSTMPRYYQAQKYIDLTQASGKDLFFPDINVPTRMWSSGFATPTNEVLKDDNGNVLVEYFGLKMNTVIMLSPNDSEGLYEFALLSDDGTVMKVRQGDEPYSVLINNDGDHPTRMGCATHSIYMSHSTRLEVELAYYQGPRYHISNVLMWRKADVAGKDALCGVNGNHTFFNPDKNSEEQKAYKDLLARQWKVVSPQNFHIPGSDLSFSDNYNPCTDGQAPVISNFRINEVLMNQAFIAWSTDIPATAQVVVTNVATGASVLTTSDNLLRTQHSVTVMGLTNRTTYRVKAVSISDSLGQAVSEEIEFTTP